MIAAALSVMGAIFKFQLYDAFLSAERNEVRQSAQAARRLFLQNLSDFSTDYADWSSWDDACQFVTDLNPEFIRSNLNDASMMNMRLNFMAFTDASGKVVFSKTYDLEQGRELPDMKADFLKREILSPVLRDLKNLSGLMMLENGSALMLILRPILNSENQGPARGVLIAGRFLNDREAERLSHQIGFQLHFDNPEKSDGHWDFLEIRSRLAAGILVDREAVITLGIGEEARGYTMLYDIEGNPALIMRVQKPRYTYWEYRRTLAHFLAFIIFAALAVIFTALYFLHMFVLKPLTDLSAFVNRIQDSGEPDVCLLPSRSGDEFSVLGHNINKMLERIRLSVQEKQKMEDRMRQSEKMSAVGQMAAAIAHEIRNPLTVIEGYSRLGTELNLSSPQAAKYFNTISAASARCTQITQDLLEFSRTGKNETELCDLNDAVLHALSVAGSHLKVSGVEVVRELEPGLPKIPLFKSRFQQVIVNLCTNAIDAMTGKDGLLPEGCAGLLRVATKKTFLDGKEGIEVAVEDSGSGIPPEVKARIFEPFFTTKPEGKGTGLGLALVAEIVDQHHGQVSVESESGKGTAFHIFLPL